MEIDVVAEAPVWLDHLFVCSQCGGLRSDPTGTFWPYATPQRCNCELEQIRQDETWTARDFNKLAELCYCCGQVLLASGSRYSVWFCQACKEEVGLLNGRLGRYQVPIGRNSLHAGWVLRPDGPDDRESIQTFCDRWNDAVQAIDRLTEWSREVVLRVIDESFGSLEGDIPIRAYLLGVDPFEGEKMRRFREMTVSLSSP